MTQPISRKPKRKIKAVGISGALSVIVLAVASRLHLALTEVEAAAIVTVILTVSGYQTKE